MTIQHSQEKIINTFNNGGISIDLVEWRDTIWCGKVGYAANNIDEPDVEKIMNDFMSINELSIMPNGREEGWDVCISLNYLSNTRPNGVMFACLVETDKQPDCYDILKIPSALYMRIQMCDETASALGFEPWKGGIPPYEWIGEHIAPKYGYQYGADTLPIIEYYGYFQPDKNAHEYCFLYVPVIKA